MMVISHAIVFLVLFSLYTIDIGGTVILGKTSNPDDGQFIVSHYCSLIFWDLGSRTIKLSQKVQKFEIK